MTTIQLRYLATVSNSNVDKLTAPDEEPVRLCNYVDVYKNDRITNDMNFMSASATQAEISKFRLRAGDILITKDSEDRHDIAVPAYVAETAPDLVCGYHLSLVRARPNRVRGDFLFWALQSKQAREAFSNAAGGVTRFGLTLDGMKSVRLACPDLPTQKAIANFLDRETARIDQLIEKKQQLVELLAEAHATRSEALLSGRSYGTGVATNGRSGHIRFLPDGWTETRLRFGIRRIEQGWSPQCEDRQVEGDDWGVLKLGAITTGEFVERAHKALPPDIAPITTYAVRAGDVLVARASGSPALVGKACLVDRVTRNLMLSDKHFRIELDPLRFDRSFFVHALNSPLGRSQIEARLSSAEGMARNIGQEVIRGLWLAVPPRDEQSKIATNIDTSASRVAATSQSIARSIDRLREFRAALITAAVTGQIDVATWSKRGEPDRRLDAIQREMAS